jgi:hypothetical protein
MQRENKINLLKYDYIVLIMTDILIFSKSEGREKHG